jgi:hypothetical protein
MLGRSAWCGVVGIAVLAAVGPGCQEIDTERQALPKATLGDDIYGVMCDRLGAGAIAEDLTGASYHSICHYDAKGHYGDTIDESVLPPLRAEKAKAARRLAVAKMERMVAYRPLLVRAFNAAFPDVDIPDPGSDDPAATVRLHDALLRFTQDVTPLYDTNPYEAGQAPIMPMATDAFGRLFGAVESNDEARQALMRIAGRQGYRFHRVGMGAVRTLLAYPEMRPFVRAQLDVMGPSGTAVAELQNLLTTVKHEMLSADVTVAPEAPYLMVDAAAGQPNRPRSAMEVTARLLLDEHEDYRGTSGAPPRLLVRRDRRGFALPLGSNPGVAGTVPAPFVDTDADGFADVDGLGRFVGSDAAPLTIESPFAIPGVTVAPADDLGVPEGSPFAYVDASRTLLAALSRDMVALVDPNEYAGEGAAEPWLEESETLMYALSGLMVLAGPREAAQYDHAADAIVAAGEACPVSSEPNPITGEVLPCTEYQRFVGEESPIPDLVHAAGQVLAHPDSDIVLLGLMQLVEEHPNVVARVLGAALRIDQIAEEHDGLAAQGLEPKAELPYEIPVWDETAQVVSAMLQHPGLTAKLIAALADPVIVQTHTQPAQVTGPPAQHFGETLSAFMRFRDLYYYDPNDINGPAYNASDGWPSFANPHNEVDRTQPLTGDNRSMYERAIQLIYDGNRIRSCNKDGAKVYTGIGDIYYPPFSTYSECELFSFDNVGAVFLDSQLPSNHPKRFELEIKDGELQGLLDFIGSVTSQDAFLENASGIVGMTLHPTPVALSRLLFFGAHSEQFGNMPDHDVQNEGSDTAKFVTSSIEPLGTIVCTPNQNGVSHCSNAAMNDLARLRDRGVIFAWERLGFFQYLRPQLVAFAEVGCNADVSACDVDDYTGESFFLDLVTALWRHWPDMDHGSYCDHAAAKDHPRYCSGAGISHYEPILADAFLTDFIPAIHEFAVVASQMQVTVQRGPRKGEVISGPEVIEMLVKILFDQKWAADAGITDRKGSSSTTWTDGTPQQQLTVYSLFADALHRMDAAFDGSSDPAAAERRSKWKRARSKLVDQFLQVAGDGNAARFENPATSRALLALLGVLREQVNANCPDRETTGQCDWAKHELGKKLGDAISRPVFASAMDLADRLNQHEPARRELERFLSYALQDADNDALFGMLAALTDLVQLIASDADFAPIFRAVSNVASPSQSPDGPGCADRTIQVLKALSSDEYDRYHVMDYLLPALVTPMDGGAGLTPLEVIVDAIADIHRTDAALSTPLDADDYRFVMKTLREFMASDTRGMRQLYYIVEHRQE